MVTRGKSEPPNPTSESFTVAKETTVNLDVLANDNILPAAGATLTIVSGRRPRSRGVVGLNGIGANNFLTYTPNSANSFPANRDICYVVSGGGIARATGTVSILVLIAPTPSPPMMTPSRRSPTAANYPLDVLANDLILPGPIPI